MPTQTFDQWVDVMRLIFQEIEVGVHAIENQLLNEKNNRATLLQTAKDINVAASSLGNPSGEYDLCNHGLRQCVRQMSLLSHSVEVAFRPAYVLRRMGVDLGELVPPQAIEYSPGNRVSITQNGEAVLVLNNSQPSHAVGLDQLGIDVPIRSEILGSSRDFNIHVVIQPAINRTRSELSVLPARQPRLSPPTALPVEQRLGLIAFAVKSLATELGQTVTPPNDFDLGLGRPTYESVCIFDYFRLFGVIGKRPRGPLPFLTSLPDWADVGVKVSSNVFVDKVRTMLTENGATLVDGPHFRPGNRFQITGEINKSVGLKIACVFFGARIRVRVTLDCSMRVVGTNRIQFTAAQSGHPDVDVTTSPYLVPGLQNLIDLALGEIIQNKIPNIHLTPDPVELGLATRLGIDLDSTHLAIYAALRF